MSENDIPWYKSKTIIIDLIAIGVTLGTIFGLEIHLTPEQITALASVIVVIATNIALRFEKDKKTVKR